MLKIYERVVTRMCGKVASTTNEPSVFTPRPILDTDIRRGPTKHARKNITQI